MSDRKATLVSSLLLVLLLLPVYETAAGTDTSPDVLTETANSLGCFWNVGLDGLAATPPEFEIDNQHDLKFTGLKTHSVQVECDLPDGRCRHALIYLTDASESQTIDGLPNCAQFVYAWRDDMDLDFDPRKSTRSHPFYRATLNAAELVEVVCGMNRIGVYRVGIVGEGYGAAMALIVAALMPHRVSFVVAHQPIRLCPQLFYCISDRQKRRRYAKAMKRIGKRLDAINLAKYVRPRSMVTVGTKDVYAPPSRVMPLYEALECDSRMVPLQEVRHCRLTEVAGLNRTWQTWAYGEQTMEIW